VSGATTEDPLASALVSGGSVHLAGAACARFLPGAVSVALLARGDRVLVLPLTPESGGGLLLKVRNARGDRVINGQEFFRNHGFVEDGVARRVAMHWDPAAAALVLTGLARTYGISAQVQT
jgi:hypothetical protein